MASPIPPNSPSPGQHSQRPASQQGGGTSQKAREALDQAKDTAQQQLGELTQSATRSAAEGLERLAQSLRTKDLDGLLHDAQDFARRQPVAFFGAAMVAGFLAVRFLKAGGTPGMRSSQERTGAGAPFPYDTRV